MTLVKVLWKTTFSGLLGVDVDIEDSLDFASHRLRYFRSFREFGQGHGP